MRWGWKAVVEMGVERLCCRKLEYGSMLLRKAPLTLKTLILCFSEPLCANADVSNVSLLDRPAGELTWQRLEHARVH